MKKITINSTVITSPTKLNQPPSESKIQLIQLKSKLKKPIAMTKSYNFNFNYALDYTCHRLNGDNKSIDFCGQCNSCQIVNYLNNLKQWFDRASHISLKKFLIGLVARINNLKIYKYLNDLLKPLTESKDFIYARNKFVPSCDEDHLKATNNRCLDNDYVNKQINQIWSWYSSSNNYIRLNFMLGLLKKCDQALVFIILLQVKSILDSTQINDIINIEEDPALEEFKINISNTAGVNSDPEIICEAYDDDDEEQLKLDDQEIKYIYKTGCRTGAKYVDFIRQLPVHLSKSILNSLDNKTLYNSLFVCKYWSNLIREVRKEGNMHQVLIDDMMLLRGTSSKGSNPKYANNMDVQVPNLYPGTYECKRNDEEKEINCSLKSECNWTNAYASYSTRNVIMEERNVFCGSYNVLLLKEKRDPHRVVHLNGNNLVAFASFDKKIRFIDLKSASEKSSSIQGHAGSIKCLYISEEKRIVFTGSYDTSLRCWSIETGKCLAIYQGHQKTITAISMHEEFDRMISGSLDKTCRVWIMGKKKPWRTFKHSYPVVAVSIGEEFCVSGGQSGKLKVFHLLSGQLIKTISAHQGPITAIRFDRWHILSCSTDGYALAFSAQGKHKKCLIAMRHPKEVLCLEFQYLRAITGSADGRIRIWNILNGDCIRVMRGNSQCDPILTMSIVDNRILINTDNNLILMEFEIVEYDYGSNRDEIIEFEVPEKVVTTPKKSKNYSAVRASRMELLGMSNVKLFGDSRKSIMDHSARPISCKCLKDAQLIHSVVSKRGNSKIVTNSAGHISESALNKRRSIMQSINAIISSQGSSNGSNLSSRIDYPMPLHSRDRNKNNESVCEQQDEIKIINDSSSFVLDEASNLRKKPSNLSETKQYLREQLKEIKQASQRATTKEAKEANNNKETLVKKEGVDTKSCVDAAHAEKLTKIFYLADQSIVSNGSYRPTSSPSRVDTKTKIKLRSQELSNMKLYSNNVNLDQYLNSSQIKFDDTDNRFESRMSELYENQVRQSNTQTIVTKIFETQEANLKSNTNMYPVNVKSKLPNPKIVNQIRPKTVPSHLNTENFTPNFLNKSPARLSNSQPNEPQAASNERSKSAAPIKMISSNPLMQRPIKTSNRPKTAIGEQLESNRFASNDHLNLKTFKEVDKIVEVINGYFVETDINKLKDKKSQAELYKKFWLLKSTGQYHGSLLAKPRAIAPEIRE